MARPKISEALRVGLIFGCIEGLTPVIGWLLGRGASKFVEGWDHWIALALLSALGLHMIHAGLTKDEDQADLPTRHGFWGLAITGFATSIDAMAVGVGLAFLNVNIAVVAVVIGACTFVMVTLGVMVGHAIGVMAGKRAEVLGGLVLIGVGMAIFFEHVYAATGK